ncbi:MAG: hypothetical protein R2867_43450 [Caldilineaceae bacterium]
MAPMIACINVGSAIANQPTLMARTLVSGLDLIPMVRVPAGEFIRGNLWIPR